jgi:hypothetical protein
MTLHEQKDVSTVQYVKARCPFRKQEQARCLPFGLRRCVDEQGATSFVENVRSLPGTFYLIVNFRHEIGNAGGAPHSHLSSQAPLRAAVAGVNQFNVRVARRCG